VLDIAVDEEGVYTLQKKFRDFYLRFCEFREIVMSKTGRRNYFVKFTERVITKKFRKNYEMKQ